MSTILALLLGSAIVGFLIGLSTGRSDHCCGGCDHTSRLSLRAVLVILAANAAITFASLLVNQIGYLIGAWLGNRINY